MELSAHPEYPDYMLDMETYQRCQEALAAWKASGESIFVEDYSLHWTYPGAQSFVKELSLLFQEYNRLLWARFPYCNECGGQCCRVGGAYIGLFDLLALILIEHPLPALPERIGITGRECIYRNARGCAWPEGWRNLKCWLFYCLGPRGDLRAGEGRPGYADIAAGLEPLVAGHLPEVIRRHPSFHGKSLVARLEDPLAFAAALGEALYDLFVAPLEARYPLTVSEQTRIRFENPDPWGDDTLKDELLVSIASTVQDIYTSSLPSPPGLQVLAEQLLSDLELLEWILLGHPENGDLLLEQIYSRYAGIPVPGEWESPTPWQQMRHWIRAIQKYAYNR